MSKRRINFLTTLVLTAFCLSGCGGTPEQKEARYLKRGDKLLAEGKLDKARVEFRNALKQKPTDANAIYHLGLVEDAQGNFRDAFVAYMGAEQQDAHFAPVLLKIAEFMLAGDQISAANQRIDAVLADNPNNADARSLLAARFLRQKLYSEAENEARKALNTDPNNVLAFGVLTGIYRSQNNAEKAAATIDDGVGRNPKNETLLDLQGKFYVAQGDFDKASRAYQRLFAVAPLEEKYRLDLAEALSNAGKTDEAEAVLRGGVSAMPDDWDMKHRLIFFLSKSKGLEPADKQIREFMRQFPDRSEPIDWLVELYISHDMMSEANSFLGQIIAQGAHDQLWVHAMTAKAKVDVLKQNATEAMQIVAAVLEKDPNNLDAQYIKAHIEAAQGNDDQAIIDLRNIIRDNPKARESYDLLSEILLRDGHTDLAIDTFNQLSDGMILGEAEQVRLAQFYAINGNPQKAKELLLISTKTDPTYPIGWEMTARLALDAKDLTTANAAIQTLDALPNQHLTALLLQGEALAVSGKYSDAVVEYENVIANDPSSPQARHALEALLPTFQIEQKLPDAIRYLETLKPDPLVNTLLGKAYFASGNDSKASSAFDSAISERATFQDPYLARGQLFIKQQQFKDALAVYEQGVRADPTDLRALLAEAQLDEQIGDTDKALALYSALQSAHPQNDVIANNFAEVVADHYSSDTTLMEKARQVTERFSSAQSPYTLDTLGWIYFKSGRTQDALRLFERAEALSPALAPQFHYHYGAALLDAGDKPNAQKQLVLATAQNAPYPGRDDATKLLHSSITH